MAGQGADLPRKSAGAERCFFLLTQDGLIRLTAVVHLKARFCCAKSAKDEIYFARLASQALLASNFCLARQKSPKSR